MATLYGFAAELSAAALPLANVHDHDDEGWIFGLTLWLAVIAVVILLIRGRGWFGTPAGRPGRGESGRELIERRFAEGKLSAEEFRQRRAVLDERGSDGEPGRDE